MNRSKQNCGNCSAFRLTEGQKSLGACCANPPVLIQGVRQSVVHQRQEAFMQGVFPPTDAAMWCRQWHSIIDAEMEAFKIGEN